jgi:hypothetical protein
MSILLFIDYTHCPTLFVFKDRYGRFKYDYVSSKGGDDTPIHKSSVMVGSCDEINFKLITN